MEEGKNWAWKRENFYVLDSNTFSSHMSYKSYYTKRENVLSEAGKKEVIFATNQELPRHIFNENSVHYITQDCSLNKTKIIKHILFRSPYLEK